MASNTLPSLADYSSPSNKKKVTTEGMENSVSLATEAPGAPVTSQRKINPYLQDQLQKPYLARALAAVDPSHPDGTCQGHDNRNLSVMQQHVSFFDRNKDGIVYPWETYKGLRALGFGIFLSLPFSILLHFAFSYVTLPCWIPSPFFPLYIKNIHKTKHGSDSETYDTEGRFDPSKFDAIFSKYALTHGNAITYKEIIKMLRGNANHNDFVGWFAAFIEWNLLYVIGKDEKSLLQRETVRACFDGSLFEIIEKNRKASKT